MVVPCMMCACLCHLLMDSHYSWPTRPFIEEVDGLLQLLERQILYFQIGRCLMCLYLIMHMHRPVASACMYVYTKLSLTLQCIIFDCSFNIQFFEN